MARVDVRTRLDEEHPPVDPDTFFASELPAAIEAHAGCIVPALEFVAPRPLTVDVDGHLWSMRVDEGRVAIASGPAAGEVARVRLAAQQLDDLASDQQTFMSMWAANRLEQPKGTIGHL